jgi:hypothetical protein
MTEEIENKFLTPEKFSLIIEEIVKIKKMTHMEAVLHYCEQNELEPEDTKKLIGKTLKDKIALNAQELNMLPKVNKLPI